MKKLWLSILFVLIAFVGFAQQIKYKGTLIKRNYYMGLVAKDTLLYAFHSQGLTVWNISDSSNPKIFKEYGINGVSPLVHGNLLIVKSFDSSEIKILDISVPDTINILGSIAYNGFLNNFYVKGDKLFLAVNGANIQVYNINRPAFPKIFEGIKMFVEQIDFIDSLFCVSASKYLIRYYFDKEDHVHVYDSIAFNAEELDLTYTSSGKTLVVSHRDTIVGGDVVKNIYTATIYDTGGQKYVLSESIDYRHEILLFNDSCIIEQKQDSLYLYSLKGHKWEVSDAILMNRNANISAPLSLVVHQKYLYQAEYTYGFTVFNYAGGKFVRSVDCPERYGSLSSVQYNNGYIWVKSSDGEFQICKAGKISDRANGDYAYKTNRTLFVDGDYVMEYSQDHLSLVVKKINALFNLTQTDSIPGCREPLLVNGKVYYRENATALFNGMDLQTGALFGSQSFSYDGILRRKNKLIAIGYNSSNRDSCFIDAYSILKGAPVFDHRVALKLPQGLKYIKIACDDAANRVYLSWSDNMCRMIDYSGNTPIVSEPFGNLRQIAFLSNASIFSNGGYLTRSNNYIHLQKITNEWSITSDSVPIQSWVQSTVLTDSFLVVSYPERVVLYDITGLRLGVKKNGATSHAGIKIYPNPSSESFYLKSDKGFVDELIILDINGQPVYKMLNVEDEKVVQHNLAPGMYFLMISTDGQRIIEKLLVVQG